MFDVIVSITFKFAVTLNVSANEACCELLTLPVHPSQKYYYQNGSYHCPTFCYPECDHKACVINWGIFFSIRDSIDDVVLLCMMILYYTMLQWSSMRKLKSKLFRRIFNQSAKLKSPRLNHIEAFFTVCNTAILKFLQVLQCITVRKRKQW